MSRERSRETRWSCTWIGSFRIDLPACRHPCSPQAWSTRNSSAPCRSDRSWSGTWTSRGTRQSCERRFPGSRGLRLPLDPMLGCIGVVPADGKAISATSPAAHGGNMDYRGFRAGVTVYLPVFAPGALFYVGDGHAIQGHGEMSLDVELTVDLRKGEAIDWPRGENEASIFTVGNARPLDRALQHATTEMLRWLERDRGWTRRQPAHCSDSAPHTTSAMSLTRRTPWSAGCPGRCCDRSRTKKGHRDRAAPGSLDTLHAGFPEIAARRVDFVSLIASRLPQGVPIAPTHAGDSPPPQPWTCHENDAAPAPARKPQRGPAAVTDPAGSRGTPEPIGRAQAGRRIHPTT